MLFLDNRTTKLSKTRFLKYSSLLQEIDEARQRLKKFDVECVEEAPAKNGDVVADDN